MCYNDRRDQAQGRRIITEAVRDRGERGRGFMSREEEHKRTISYYDHNAEKYFWDTVNVDMTECYQRFMKYVAPPGKIMDIGAGSGRDARFFRDQGFEVEALDASESLCRLATAYTGVEVRCVRVQDWRPQGTYDGIWANASLLHLSTEELEAFIGRVPDYLNGDGVLYASLKTGIQTGYDAVGRFFTDFPEGELRRLAEASKSLEVAESWIAEDKLGRAGLRWVNLILKKEARSGGN